jgi:hypothetical protein
MTAPTVTEEDLAYFERWADALAGRINGYSGTYTEDVIEDLKDRGRRMKALVDEVRSLRARTSA